MEDGKKAVLVATLSTYDDLLVKNTPEDCLKESKGKDRALNDDVDLETESQDPNLALWEAYRRSNCV